MTSSIVDKIKLWIFPSMVSLIGIFIYAEIKEIKSDVKALLAQSNIDKTRIDNLEREVYDDRRTAQADPFKQKYPPRHIPIMMLEALPPKNETDEEEESNKKYL